MAYRDNGLQQLRNERRRVHSQVEKLDSVISVLEEFHDDRTHLGLSKPPGRLRSRGTGIDSFFIRDSVACTIAINAPITNPVGSWLLFLKPAEKCSCWTKRKRPSAGSR